MLAKKDREQVQRDRDLKARDQAITEREAKFKAAKDDPYQFIEKELGVSYDAWTERLVKGPKPVEKDPVKDLQSTVEKLQQEAKDREQRETQSKTQAQHDKALSEFRTGIAAEIAKTESLELCRIMGNEAIDQAEAVVAAHARETGELLPLAEALTLVEGFYEESGAKFLQSKKLTAKLSSTTPAATSPTPAKPSQTITSKDAPSTSPAPAPRGKDAEWRALQQKYKGKIFVPDRGK